MFGGPSTNNGVIGGSSCWRSAYAVFAYREGGVRQIIVSGGGATAIPIAASMGVERALARFFRSDFGERQNRILLRPWLDLRSPTVIAGSVQLFSFHLFLRHVLKCPDNRSLLGHRRTRRGNGECGHRRQRDCRAWPSQSPAASLPLPSA